MKEKKRLSYSAIKPTEPAVLRDASAAGWGRIVTVRDAKAHLSALLEWVAAGHELTITSDGQPKAKLVGVSATVPRKVFQGMGNYLMKQPIHSGPSAEAVVREDRDGRGW